LEVVKVATEAVIAEREVDGMDSGTIYKGLSLLIFFGIPFLYVRKVKHPAIKMWDAYARFVIILYGSLIIGGFLVGYLISYYGLKGAHGMSTAVTNGIIVLLMGFLAFIAFYVAQKRIQTAPRSPSTIS
jgi:hypothetical protein